MPAGCLALVARAGTDPKPEDALKYVYAPTPATKAPIGAERRKR